MSYTMNGEQHQESTKTTKELAIKILKQRESEIVLGLFKVGWAGERVTFEELCRPGKRRATHRNHICFRVRKTRIGRFQR